MSLSGSPSLSCSAGDPDRLVVLQSYRHVVMFMYAALLLNCLPLPDNLHGLDFFRPHSFSIIYGHEYPMRHLVVCLLVCKCKNHGDVFCVDEPHEGRWKALTCTDDSVVIFLPGSSVCSLRASYLTL